MPVVITLFLLAAPTGGGEPDAAAAQPDRARNTLLVLDVRPIGVDENAVATLTAQIAEIIAQSSKLAVSTMADIKDMATLERTRQIMGCEEDAACLAEISSAANADLVLTSTVGKVGNSIVINLTLVDAKKAGPISRASEVVEGLDSLEAALPQILAQLFGWEGSLRLVSYKLPEGARVSFAVFDLKASGVPPEVAQSLTQILSVEIKRVEGTSVISRDDLMAMLRFEKDKNMLGCVDDVSCVAEIGGALGVDKLVVGHVGKLAESYVVSLRLIDARAVKVDSRVTESYKGSEDQLIGAVRHSGRRLLGVGLAEIGNVAVTSSEEQAEVFVDNEKRGQLPMPPIAELATGRHVLRLNKAGFFDWQTELYVDPQATAVVWAQMQERPEKWYQKWWVWTIVGTVAVAATITGVSIYVDQATAVPETDLGAY